MGEVLRTALCAVLLAVACAQGPREPAPAGALVAGVNVYSSWHQWKLTPWVRIAEDMTRSFPVYVVFSSDGRACLVDAPTWVLAKNGDYLHCKSGWRFPR